jgi:hypothetical protein
MPELPRFPPKINIGESVMTAKVPASTFKQDYRRTEMFQAINEVVDGLKAAAVPEARDISPDGFRPVGGNRNYVSYDSLVAWGKANDLTKGEMEMFKQVVKTWSGRVKQGAVDKRLQRVELNSKTLKSLKTTLRSFFETHNKAPVSVISGKEVKQSGDTAQHIAAQFDNLTSYDYSAKSTETPREYAIAVDKLMNDLYDVKKGQTWGRSISLSALFQTIRGNKRISKSEADAMFKAFRYVSRTMSWGRSNNSYICFDQRVEVQRILMKLFAGNSPTKRAIEKAYGN